MEIRKAKLTLVGAGPGDPELITLKAIRALETADVILYDALVNEALMDYAAPSTLKIYVGKRAGMHSQQQQEINKMIVGFANTMGHVVRLKGGDPYVFGRGHEELEYAENQGIPVTYIPGISSATAVPGLAGIPLTKRGINESFWVITGTLKDGSLSKDLHWAAQSSATIIILMGLKKLPEIIALYKFFRGEEELLAIIQNGSQCDSKCLVSSLGKVLEAQKTEQIAAPALLVIGKVVGERTGNLIETLNRENWV